MTPWLVLGIVIFLIFAIVVTLFVVRRPVPAPPPSLPAADSEEHLATRQELLDERENELMERRIELDARRGTLGGNTAIYDAFETLERRLQSGEISEQEFEAEKIRLLSGQ